MTDKPLPIGIQTFRDLIQGGYLYVDKTLLIYELIRYPKGVYFLSRPRRFGKSLLVSTLDEIFRGDQALFKGLWLEKSDYQWARHPVIHLDFSLESVKTAEELIAALVRFLGEIAAQHGHILTGGNYQSQFRELIRHLAAERQVVVLVDEYDKPIIDNIENTAEAEKIRDILKGFYTIIKGMDAYIRFVFLTGISKFSRVGVFSGLNNLQDISMDGRFSALPGITQNELEQNFAPYFRPFADKEKLTQTALLEKIQDWYNGFCFSNNCERVYNPFSLLLLFNTMAFRNYWFESGTPTFLIKLIRQQQYNIQQLENLELDELAFSSYEVGRLNIVPLLFQTGYLTIKNYDDQSRLYRLDYPNFEVENAFLRHLLAEFSSLENGMAGGQLWQLIRALRTADFERFFQVLQSFFAGIPYDIQIRQERYYQTIFFLIFKIIGLEVSAEVRTSQGRIDAVIELEEGVFLFEFKLDGTVEEALRQIRERVYFAPYLAKSKPIHLVGVTFGMQEGITSWKTESIS